MTSEKDIVVFCADVGSTRKDNFAWIKARQANKSYIIEDTGNNINRLVEEIETSYRKSHVAFGLESPLFLPVPEDRSGLSFGRKLKGKAGKENLENPSCLSQIGGYVTVLGLHQLTYVLKEIDGSIKFTLDFEDWSQDSSRILIWEAFVSGNAKTDSDDDHEIDAITAAVEFFKKLLLKTQTVISVLRKTAFQLRGLLQNGVIQ